MLEVLEHIRDCRRALRAAIGVARRFVILSVPSQPDENPQHVHLFDENRLRTLFADGGVCRVSFDYVPGHILAVAKVADRA
jgi:hypothetical protein